MSKKKNNSVTPVEEQDVIQEEPVVETPVEKPVVKKPKTVKGTIVGCVKLNVREQMHIGATILCTLPAGTEVKVIVDETHEGWYHVFTKTGVEGFCVKKYISINS